MENIFTFKSEGEIVSFAHFGSLSLKLATSVADACSLPSDSAVKLPSAKGCHYNFGVEME